MRAVLLLAATSTAHAYARATTVARPHRAATPKMLADAGKTFRRAEFWESETATLLEVANVIGRWQTASQWTERTEFSIVEDQRAETMAQGASKSRFEMAQRNGLAERVAMQQNVPKLPFTDAKLAASFGKSVDDFNAMTVSKESIDIVYDALAESKSSLLPAATIDARRANWMDDNGSINEGALSFGLLKSRVIVCISWIFFGKGQLYGLLVGGKVVLDATNAFEKLPQELLPYADAIYWALSLSVAAFAWSQAAAVQASTADYETTDGSDPALDDTAGYSGVLEKWGRAMRGGD